MLYPLVVSLGERLLGGVVWHGPRSVGRVALTFDDGPDPANTRPLLDILHELEVPATFFWLGSRLESGAGVVERIARSSHQIALHAQTHAALWHWPADRVVTMYRRLQDTTARITGREPMRINCVRPPFGLIRPRQVAALAKAGLRTILCDVLPNDWIRPPKAVVARLLRHSRPGSIIALHDGEPRAGRTVSDAVRHAVSALRDRGWTFTTVDDLLSPATR